MPRYHYLRRAALTLTCLASVPASIGIAELLFNHASSYGFPTGTLAGILILLATGGIVLGAILLALIALLQPRFFLALLVGVGIPLCLEGFLLPGPGVDELAEGLFWVSVLALPIILGAATPYGYDGRRWLRWGGWATGGVLVPLVYRSPYLYHELILVASGWAWIPFAMMGTLGVWLYKSLPATPVRLARLLVEGLIACVLFFAMCTAW